MHKTVRFPKPERMAKGRNGFFETSGVSLLMDANDVLIEAWTARNGGQRSEAARILVPFSHLREFRDALNDMLTHVMAIEGERLAVARGDASVMDLLTDDQNT